MNKQRIVLLGSAGTGTAFAAACALRRVWSQSVGLIAMDINPRHLVTTALLADHYEQAPLSAAPEFARTLTEILRQHRVDTYQPFFPEEIALAARMRANGGIGAAVTVIAPPVEASTGCADKWRLGQWLSQSGVPIPQTAPATAPFLADEYFLKPNNGSGSRGARKITAGELAGWPGAAAAGWIVQEICVGPEVTVDAFYDPASGFHQMVCRERIEIKSGVTTKARLFADEGLQRLALAIAQALGLAGSFCFQVMSNAAGWAVTDVNPRPGAATAMCALTGNDFFAAAFARCWGEDPQPFFRPLQGDHFVTRQYAEFLTGGPA
jgi:carbamoylphosphate synthase large subunit